MTSDFRLQQLIEIVQLADGLGVRIWLDGGWCVDALIGSDGLPRDSWQPVPQLILFDVQSGLLLRNYEHGEVARENLDGIGRPRLAKSVLSDQPVRSDVTAYKKIVYPASGEHFSNVLWSFSIKFGSAGGNGTFLLVIRQTVVTGICKEL